MPTRRFRILIAHSRYRIPGGEDRYVEQQDELLRSRGHEVRLLLEDNSSLPGGLRTAARMTYSKRILEDAERAIESFRPDVVHLHNAYPALGPAVHLAAERKGIPLVMTVHNYRLRCPNGYMFTEGDICRRCTGGNHVHAVLHRCFEQRSQGLAYAASLWWHRFIARLDDKVAAFVCPSRFVNDQMRSWGFPEDRLHLVRNFTPVPAHPSEEVGEYGMYVGRLSPEKGLDVLLEALLHAGDPPFRVVGDGPIRKPLQEVAGSLGLKRTKFTGRVTSTKVAKFLNEVRLMVVPSLWHETASLAAFEAMAAARPLIVTDRGGLPELVSEGGGTMCRADAFSIADALSSYLDDEELCRLHGRAAYDFAVRELGPERHAALLRAVYESVA